MSANGVEACTEDVAYASADERGVSVAGSAFVTDVELGFETVDVSLVASEGADGWSVEQGHAAVVVDCILDIAHGDHCHLGVPTRRACAVDLAAAEVRAVDVEGSRGAMRVIAGDTAPACCVSTCPDTSVPPRAEPAGPYTIDLGWAAP